MKLQSTSQNIQAFFTLLILIFIGGCTHDQFIDGGQYNVGEGGVIKENFLKYLPKEKALEYLKNLTKNYSINDGYCQFYSDGILLKYSGGWLSDDTKFVTYDSIVIAKGRFGIDINFTLEEKVNPAKKVILFENLSEIIKIVTIGAIDPIVIPYCNIPYSFSEAENGYKYDKVKNALAVLGAKL